MPDGRNLPIALEVNAMTLNCKDGTLEIDDHVYERSCLVRDLIDNTPNWIAEHSKQEVYDEIEELFYK